MKNIKNYKTFLENYSDEVENFIETEKKFALIKGNDVILGFDELANAFNHLADILLKEKQLTIDEKDEFEADVVQKISNIDVDQDNIDNILNELLDKYNVIEPYYIKEKDGLENTPIDTSLDIDDSEDLNILLGDS